MEKIHCCVAELEQFFKSVLANDWQKAETIHHQILQLESEADELKKKIRSHLPSNLFMPVSRTDLLELLTVQDKIASKAKHISSIVCSRKIMLPDVIATQYLEFINKCIETSAQARKAIYELDELIETGFKGREVKIVGKMILELDQLERETDRMQVDLREQLFSIEKTLNPIEAMFLYKIIDWAGELADRAHNVGYRLESLLAQ